MIKKIDDILDEIGNDEVSRLIRKDRSEENQKTKMDDPNCISNPLPKPEPAPDGLIPLTGDIEPEPYPPYDGEIDGEIDDPQWICFNPDDTVINEDKYGTI